MSVGLLFLGIQVIYLHGVPGSSEFGYGSFPKKGDPHVDPKIQ